jgi:hypothetical protein
MLSRQRHKADAGDLFGFHLLATAGDLPQDLESTLRSHRDDQPSTFFELPHQRRRHVIRRGGDDDGVVGRVLLPAIVAVGVLDGHVPVAQRRQPLRSGRGALAQVALFMWLYSLNAVAAATSPAPQKAMEPATPSGGRSLNNMLALVALPERCGCSGLPVFDR